VFDIVLFTLSAVLVVLGSLGVLFIKENLMHACVSLLTTLFGVAGLYATLGGDFLAATQLVVYVGGVVILMLFAIMLTGGGSSNENRFSIEKIPAMGNIKTYIIAGLNVSVISLVVIRLMANVMKDYEAIKLPAYESTVDKIGTLLVTDHVLAFEISSILLLGALVGAAIIARPRRSVQ
jgi:NADH:ubiquinone oxidoreductase subunit 6 (subunit J)